MSTTKPRGLATIYEACASIEAKWKEGIHFRAVWLPSFASKWNDTRPRKKWKVEDVYRKR